PMRKFSDARLPKRRAIHTGDVNGVTRPLGIELDQLCSGERTRERAVSRMIPSAHTNARRVTKPALHLVSDRRGTDCLLAARADALRKRKDRGKIVARMRRLFGEIRVVIIEIANATSVRERGPVRRRLMRRSDDCRS